MKTKGSLKGLVCFFAVLCVLSGPAMLLCHEESLEYKFSQRGFVVNVLIPVIHLLSLYAAVITGAIYLRSKGQKTRFVEKVLTMMIIVLWTLIILPSITGSIQVRERRVPNPPGQTAVSHIEKNAFPFVCFVYFVV